MKTPFDLTNYIQNLEGTNCYLDDSVKDEVRSYISHIPLCEIHFWKSGNYHYLSYLFLERIDYDFSLLLFDNHPDMQSCAFSDILSCGSWVLDAIKNFSHLKFVYVLGASDEHIKEESPMPANVCIIDSISQITSSLPIYISIDKDVLSQEYAFTDWDQGKMSLDELCGHMNNITISNIEVIGIDICGDSKSDSFSFKHKINSASNLALFDCCPLPKSRV